jgi:hypothetical protein
MSVPSTLYGDFILPGNLALTGTAQLPAAAVTDTNVSGTANISQAKIQSRPHATYGQAGGADAANATQVMFRAHKACTVLAAKITPDVVPAGGTKALAVDVKKSTAGGNWTSILTGTGSITANSAARTPVALTLSGTPTLIADDLLQASVTISGSNGTNVQGFLLDVILAEDGT